VSVIAWIVEGSWPACVDAARRYAPADTDIVLLHVTSPEIADTAHGAYAGLLGRGHPERDPGATLQHMAAATAEQLLTAAAARLGSPCSTSERSGRPEREVVAAADGAAARAAGRTHCRQGSGPASGAEAGSAGERWDQPPFYAGNATLRAKAIIAAQRALIPIEIKETVAKRAPTAPKRDANGRKAGRMRRRSSTRPAAGRAAPGQAGGMRRRGRFPK